MSRDGPADERLDEVEAVLRSLVIRVTELEIELESERRRSSARAEAPAPRRPEPAPQSVAPSPVPRSARPAPPALAPRPAPTTAPRRPTEPPRPPRPPSPPKRTLGDLARDWDLMGARGFAIAGGAVMALGIGLFFVLAANRGWIDAQARVALGAAASALVFGAGLLLRSRYGQYWSALAAVGAGIAGAYATLAAAAARYDLVPDVLALPLAGAIAAVATVVALRWTSQVIAAIGLLGAALAPALQALDTDMAWESAAFAVIVLAAAAAVAVPRRWHELLISATVVVGLQVEWLAVGASSPLGAGTVTVAAAFVLMLLAIAVGRQLVASAADVDPVALAYALAAFGIGLAFGVQLFEQRTDRGAAFLAAAGAWALVFVALQRRRLPDLALVLGTSSLAFAAVGAADLLSDAALTIAWAAEALVLAFVARRFGDARLQAFGIVYAALAATMALTSYGRPSLLFEEGAAHVDGVVPLGAAAAAAIGCGLLAPGWYTERTETGLLAFVANLRKTLAAYRAGLREALVFAGGALATLGAAFLCVSISWEWGHVAATVLAALVGAVFLAAAGRLGSNPLAAASYVWLGVVLAEALAFDLDTFANEPELTVPSTGGWSVIAAAAGLLAGSYAHRLFSRGSSVRDALLGGAASFAAAIGAFGITSVTEGSTARGLGLLAAATVYAALAGAVFSRAPFRDAATILWSLALGLLVGAEWFLVEDPVARTVAVSATALVVGALGHPLAEIRLWLAGSVLGLVTTVAVVAAHVRPWREESELETVLAVGLGACVVATVGLAALRFGEPRLRDAVTVLWASGTVGLLAFERVLLGGWEETTFAAALIGTVLGVLARPLSEERLWIGGLVVVGVATVAAVSAFTPPSQFFSASESPAAGVWVLAGCIVALVVLGAVASEGRNRVVIEAVAGGLTLYAVSLMILEVAERVSSASVETDFERGHTAVSALWALVGLGLLVLGLLRGSAAIRYAGLVLFGLSLAKIFVYDLAELSSVARAFSFIFVGGLLLAGGFFLQRLSDRLGPREP